ncbi:unnamed protein product, partial [marine sediment metagenome]
DNTSNSSNLYDYQVEATIDTATPIAAGHMESDCSDIRFTDDSTNWNDHNWDHSYSYWIESGCNTSATKIWVKVPSISASSQKTIYMYYGNASATSQSNGDNTFIAFDDFESGAEGDALADGWTIVAGTCEYDDAQAWGGSQSGGFLGDVAADSRAMYSATSINSAVRFRVYKEDATHVLMYHGDGVTTLQVNLEADEDIMYRDDVGSHDTGSDITADTWQLMEYRNFDWGADTFDIILNGVKILDDGGLWTNGSAND